jgi:hypothetical protein
MDLDEITSESHSWRSYKDGVKNLIKLLQNLIHGGVMKMGSKLDEITSESYLWRSYKDGLRTG